MEDAHYETVQASGYWYPEKQPGDPFFQGELLGRVESGAGETLQAITALFDGANPYPGCEPGDAPFGLWKAAGGRGTFPQGEKE